MRVILRESFRKETQEGGNDCAVMLHSFVMQQAVAHAGTRTWYSCQLQPPSDYVKQGRIRSINPLELLSGLLSALWS